MDGRDLESLQTKMDEHGINIINDDEMNIYLNKENDSILEPSLTPFRYGPVDEDYVDSRDFAYDPTEEEDYSVSSVQDSEIVVEEEKNKERAEIERKITKFKNNVAKVSEHIEQINRSLILGDVTSVSEEIIRQVNSEIMILLENSNELVVAIDAFKEKYENADLSMNYNEIMSELQTIKNDLRALKQLHVESYNYAVEATKLAIEDLRNLGNEKINSELDNLPELTKCQANIVGWNASLKYLDSLNYDLLREVNSRLSILRSAAYAVGENEYSQTTGNESGDVSEENNSSEIVDEEKTSDAPSLPSSDEQHDESEQNERDENDSSWSMMMWDLHSRMNDVELNITNIEKEITDEILPLEVIHSLRDKINDVSSNLVDFFARLEEHKDDLGQREYDDLYERYSAAIDDLFILNNKLNKKGIDLANNINEKYNELKLQSNSIMISLQSFERTVNSVKGYVSSKTVGKWLENLKNYEKDVEQLENDVKSAFENKKIDSNQQEQLNKSILSLKEEIEKLELNLKEPSMVNDAGIFEILNDQIDVLEKTVDDLAQQIEKLKKPIKREDRKGLDKIFKYLEKEINRLEKVAHQYKDNEPEKYNVTVERINDLKEKIDLIEKNYRKKCPLIVRTVKSAKNLYKKHKKKVLIAAGLAAFALASYQILIPAIIHGNIMVGFTSPALRPIVEFFNRILGSVIGATTNEYGAVFLANGMMINPTVASTSLLKGLAMSGGYGTALVAPIILAIKKLVEKMKTAELKHKFTEKLTKGTTAIKETAGKVTKNVKGKASSAATAVKNIPGKIKTKSGEFFENISVKKEEKNYDKLLSKYESSDEYESLEDFCEKEELNASDLKMLQIKQSIRGLEKQKKEVLKQKIQEENEIITEEITNKKGK